jgi:hypothetical protein
MAKVTWSLVTDPNDPIFTRRYVFSHHNRGAYSPADENVFMNALQGISKVVAPIAADSDAPGKVEASQKTGLDLIRDDIVADTISRHPGASREKILRGMKDIGF